MELRFTYVKITKIRPIMSIYHFEISREEGNNLYFSTYDDLSGFRPNYDITQPRDLITLGVEILANMQYIREQVKKHRRKNKDERHN